MLQEKLDEFIKKKNNLFYVKIVKLFLVFLVVFAADAIQVALRASLPCTFSLRDCTTKNTTADKIMNAMATINSTGDTSNVSTRGTVLFVLSSAKSPLDQKEREILKEYTESDMPETMLNTVHMGRAT